jgi:hypothetical protein
LRAGAAGASNDIDAWRAELAGCAQAGGWQVQELGPVLGHSLPLLRTGRVRAGAPRLLLASAAAHFDLHPDGVVDDCPVSDGVVFNRFDGSFESWFSEQGVPLAACIETPGQHDLTRRVRAQAALMRAFVEHVVALAACR